MLKNVNVLRLLPDRPGRGGCKFGYHSFQQQPLLDTRSTKSVYVWQDSWRSDYGGRAFAAGSYFIDDSTKDNQPIACLALHGYTKFSRLYPAAGPDTEILGHHTATISGTDTAYIWNYNSFTDYSILPGPVIAWTSHQVCPASTVHPAVFANIGNRCFIATGENECFIYDRTTGNDVFGDGWGTPLVYPLGVSAPTAAPAATNITTVQTAQAYASEGSKYLNHPDPGGALSSTAGGGGDIYGFQGDGITWSPGSANDFDLTSKATSFSTAGIYVSIPNGSNIGTFSGAAWPTDGAWIGLTLTVNGFSFVMMEFGNSTPGSTLAADECRFATYYKNGKLPYEPDGSGGGWDPARDISAQSFTVTGVSFVMQRGGLDITWPGGVSGTFTIIGDVLDAGGMLTWGDTPPSYAYAWYDPTTGHISNISPIFGPTGTGTEVGVQINVDVGQISYPPNTTLHPNGGAATSPYPRFTHILFFRTLASGGSTLYPIGSLSPTIPDPADPSITTFNPEWKGLPDQVITSIPPAGTGNYWRDNSRDSDLLISGALRAPQFTNGKPRIVQNGQETLLFPKDMAYWDGRLWIAATQDPGAIHYSCDRVQCPFGVPEESFPDTNVLRIPAEDGCVRGMKLIGERLLVTTERWAYTIAGNNESNYRLVRVSTRMGSVGTYQMDEFVPEVEGEPAIVVFIASDSRVYAMPLGGQAVWISRDIQTVLDSYQLFQRRLLRKCRVHCLSVAGKRFALLYIEGPGLTDRRSFMYDFDQKVWTEHTFQNDNNTTQTGYGIAWTSTSTSADATMVVYGVPTTDTTAPIVAYPVMTLRRFFNQATTTPIPSGFIRTFPMTFDNLKTRKQLHFVRIYVNNQSFQSTVGLTTLFPWRVRVRLDSNRELYTATPTVAIDTAYNLLVGGTTVDSATDRELIATDAQLTSGEKPIIGYTFDVEILFPDQSDMLYQLYAVDIGWSTVSEGQLDI